MPARVRSERTTLSNCANAARTPSISLPVEVSSIGSVKERREIPSDCRCDRSAKWSYLSLANRVRLSTTKCARPLFSRQKVSRFWSWAAIRGLGALAFLVKFLRADANVDHRADHDGQRRSIRRLGQGAFARHRCYPEMRHRSWYISTTMHAIVSASRRMFSMSSSVIDSASSPSSSRQRAIEIGSGIGSAWSTYSMCASASSLQTFVMRWSALEARRHGVGAQRR